MRILTVGAGAVGGYFGALLARAGEDVTFLVRPGRAAVLRERGLRISGLGEDWSVSPTLVTADTLDGPYDLVLLSVKSTALEAALDGLAPAVGPDTVIVPLLNGLAQLDALTARFGPGPVLGGVAKVVTTLDADGGILRLAPPAVVLTGELPAPGADAGAGTGAAAGTAAVAGASDRVSAVRKALTGAGIDSPDTPDALGAMWHKWAFIVSLAALTVLGGGSVGEVNAAPGGPELARAVLAEAAAVAAAAGRPLPADELALTEGVVTASGSPLTPSLYRDLLAGAPTEVEHLFGDLTARARALGVATPLLDLATLRLRVAQERALRG
ncbi:2-dehydropantoate 2-reductase [Streptomyces sp. NPDC097619]|uniref:ketopantoate reductase family protein n=1 Tax=Streptomyces sp. NPDC097619 TaxID=3157228 RepID=UPI0033209DDD